ncbi:MAG: cupin [Gammaproteobacteria bacterium]|nr:MAG: cupin [Gammaproteobacteria bacterium]
MSGLTIKSFGTPDEVRPFTGMGHADVVNLGPNIAMRGVFEPGWKWKEHVAPLAETHSCEAPHLLYCISGRMKIVMDDGAEGEIGPGDTARIEPGHDAWVVGDETCEVIDFGGFIDYAKKA